MDHTDSQLGELWSLGDYVTPLVLRAICDLGVADHLTDDPVELDTLADRIGAEPDSLLRALRLLVARGVFVEPAPECFALNELASLLRSDHPLSAKDTLSILPADIQAWAAASYSVRTGQSAFGHVHGTDRWSYLAENPSEAKSFHARMRSASRRMGAILAASYPWTGQERVADIGGGSGGVLVELLKRYPGMTGILFDQPRVVEDAPSVLGGSAERVDIVGGDFFSGVPGRGDVYLLVNVLHDWDDDRAALILSRVAERIAGSTRLLVVEGVPGVDGAPARSGALDLHMLVVWGGRERRLEQWEQILATTGLCVRRTMPAGPRWILECTR